MVELVLWNPDARVHHHDPHSIVDRLHANPDLPTGRSELDRVGHEVENDLPQLVRICESANSPITICNDEGEPFPTYLLCNDCFHGSN